MGNGGKVNFLDIIHFVIGTIPTQRFRHVREIQVRVGVKPANKENNVFKDGIGVKGLRFNLHGNNDGNHG